MKLQDAVRIFILFLFISPAISAEKNFHLIEKKELPKQLGTFREIALTAPDAANGIIYAVTLNQNYHSELYLHDSQNQFFADYLDSLSQDHEFIVGINGGFYQPDFTPVGLFIYKGKKIKPLVHNSLLKSCVIINNADKIQLETDLSACNRATNAMQTGPLLIDNGKVNTKLQEIKNKSESIKNFFDPHKRTALAVTTNNDVIMLTTSQFTLIDLANFLQNNPDAFGVTQIQTAVNLDGGSSTGMYIRFPEEPFYLHELKHVKTFIFVY